MKIKKHKFHWIHLIAVFILGGYFVLSKINLVNALTRDVIIVSFIQLFIFGTVCTYLFLYIFSHEKFFPFAKEIEKKEEKKEQAYLKRYLHHGKILATFIIGVLGGPIFLSLTTRVMLNKFNHKYLFIFFTSFISTLFTLGVGKGLVKIFI